MKTKQTFVAAAALLLALLCTVPFWPPRDGGASPGPLPATMPAGDAADATVTATTTASRSPAPLPRAIVDHLATTTATLTVRLLQEGSGAPAAGIGVLCRRGRDAGRTARSDELGNVAFVALRPGDYVVHALVGDAARVTLAAGEHRTIDLVVPAGKAATGIVLDRDDRPVAGAEILASWRGRLPQRLLAVGASDDSGRFTVAGLPLYAVLGARHEELGTSDFRLLLGDPSQGSPTVTLRLPGTARIVRGRVVDMHGAPLEGAWVQIGEDHAGLRRDCTGDIHDVLQWPPAAVDDSAADGAFAITGLQARDQRLLVHHAGFAPHRAVLHLEAADAPDLLVVLRPGGTLVGTVRDADGRALAGARIERKGATFPEQWTSVTDAAGGFRYEDLPPGEVELEVAAGGMARERRTFVFTGAETQRTDIVLRTGSTIRGRLLDHRHQPLAGWQVGRLGSGQTVTTAADGSFELDDPAAGDNTLVVRSGTFAEVLRCEHVLAGLEEQTFVVAAEHRASAWLRGRLVDPAGMPLADAEIQLLQDEWPVLDGRPRPAADGSFAIGPLPPGTYELAPSRAGLLFAPVPVTLGPEEQRDLGELHAVRPARLQVRLAGPNIVLARTRVELVAGELRLSTLDSGPRRTFATVMPGRYRLVVSVDGRELQATDVELTAGGEERRDIVVE